MRADMRNLLTHMRRSAEPSLKCVLVAAATENGSHRGLVTGVSEYRDRHANWVMLFASSTFSEARFQTQARAADAALVAWPQPERAEHLRQLGIPVVAMGLSLQGIPSVEPDERAVGEMAFGALRDLGLEHMAFCGMPQVPFSVERRNGFVQAAERAGCSISIYHRAIYAEMHQTPHEMSPFSRWLRSLPVPTGLFVPTAELASGVMFICRQLGISIPDQLAVLGVDDDEILCNLCHPRLSVIDQNPERIGFEAARMLDAILQGRPAPPQPIRIEPRGVVGRESTDMVNSDSPEIAQAIRFIRGHVEEGITVAHVLRAVPMSRRALERGFLRNVGRTIHDEIVRTRVSRAKELLDRTGMQLPEIAARCGFSYPSKLSAVFKRETGTTPSDYRRRMP